MYEPLDTRIVEQTLKLMSFESLFNDPIYVEFVESAYRSCVPIEFFIQPASSSGKYHPGYALGVGGLVRHTKATLIIAKMLFRTFNFSKEDEDLVFAALALHDIAKPSKLHPIEVKPLLDPLMDDYYDIIKKVLPLIESHMGKGDQFGRLPQPKTPLQTIVHICDYLASRKNIYIDLDYQES